MGISVAGMDISYTLHVFMDAFLRRKSNRKAVDVIPQKYPQVMLHKHPKCNTPEVVQYFFKESGTNRKISVTLLRDFS